MLQDLVYNFLIIVLKLLKSYFKFAFVISNFFIKFIFYFVKFYLYCLKLLIK